ncbi:hypothetical protein LEN26_007166 [Aphanomyces euteiches]|nr:hypothetical protein AeMF1_011413 [Aphanomyces euteiches]KAH9133076.1 hypothetical protein LEN26_007166 [Aphanomyces euteiches]KAH9188704.1 hypothetical protein AeNC1_009320 [Aphanomyces euteiches]
MDHFARQVEHQAKNVERHARALGARAEEFGQHIQQRASEIEASVRSNQGKVVFKFDDVFKWVKNTFGDNTDTVYDCAKNNDLQALLQILESEDPNVLPKLLEYKDSRGRTPLMIACSNNFEVCVQILLEHGAFIDATDVKGNTPLHHACKDGAARVVEYLTSLPGVSPYLLNTRGLSPLEVARRSVETGTPGAAACVQLMEARTQVFQGWLYESTENIGSALLGMSSLQSWAKRFVLVLRVGSPLFLEMAFFDVIQGQRSPLPSSTLMLHVPSPVTLHTKNKLFDSKPFAITVRGARKTGPGIVGSLRSCELAATDQASFYAWATFLAGGGVTTALSDPSLTTYSVPPPVQAQMPQPTVFQNPVPPCPSMAPNQENMSEAPSQFQSPLQAPPAAAPVQKTVEVYEPPSVPTVVAASAPPLEDHSSDYQPEESIPRECVVCFDGPQNAVCVPCGHAAVCMRCAEQIKHSTKQCAVCRADVREVIQLFHV